MQSAREFFVTLDKIKYNLLNLNAKPFIFAYSALVNDEVREKTTLAGFDACLSSPLNSLKFKNKILPVLNGQVDKFLSTILSADQIHELEHLREKS